jgi:hypothetical protein
MNTSRRKKSLAFVVNQGVAVVTAGAFLFSSLGASAAEATFWEERAAASARRHSNPSAGQTLLARLPFAPVSAVAPLSRAAVPLSVSLGEKAGSSWLRETVSPFADVRSARDEFNSDLRVWLVMDAHDVYSAQRNVARLLAQVGARRKTVVGVEGSTGEFRLDPFRNILPQPQYAELVDHLLKKGFINGPEAYGLLNPSARLWGVETSALYDDNVQSYRDSLSLEAQAKNALDALKKESARKSTELFSQDVRALDDQSLALHEDRVNLAQYAQVVWSSAGQAGAPSSNTVFKNVALFLGAHAKEKTLSFPQVEQARAAFIERLSPRLSPDELDSLVKDTTDFRAGRVGAAVYYRSLDTLARSKGVPLSAYPAFQEYVSYVVEAERIDVAALFEELDELEDRAFARLAVGEAGVLVQWNRDLRLAERAVQHALTPREWARYQNRAPSLAQLEARARDLGLSSAPVAELSGLLPRFAAFFEKAQARNKSLLDNLIDEARRQHADCAVLVTGGFHVPALARVLTESKISHVVLSPRMGEVPESAANYLQAFAPTRTPLERLLLGDRLYMNPPSATSAAVQKNGHEFHGSAVALNRAALTYGSLLAGAGNYLPDFVRRWNERFSESGQAVARQSNHRGVQLAEVQFEGAGQSVYLATPAEGAAVSGESLAQAVNKKGARVVETDRVGNVSYVLGGKSVTRIVPELLSGAAFLLWLGASSLAPPSGVAVVGFLSFVVVGGMSVRGLFMVSTYWHGLGHALAARVFAKKPVRDSLAEYSQNIPLGQLAPFSSFFLPGVTSPEQAPHFSVDRLAPWKLRLAALSGPLMNLAVVVSLVPFLSATGPVSLSGLALWAVAGINLWAGLSSGSDWRTVLSGVGRSFFCGVIGVVYGGPNPKQETFPQFVRKLLHQAILRTLHRGGQSAGVSVVGVKENGHAEYAFFVEKTAKEKNRRALLGSLMRSAMDRLADRAQKAGFGGLSRILVVGHTRYGTNLAQPIAVNAHPHGSASESDRIYFIGDKNRDDKYERPWSAPAQAPAVKSLAMERGVSIAHNGDDNVTVLYRRGGQEVTLSNDDDARLSERMTGYKNPAQGDSPQIATRMDRWLTQGSVRASVRLALLMLSVESLGGIKADAETLVQRAPSRSEVETVLQANALESVGDTLADLHRRHSTAATWDDLFASAGAQDVSTEKYWDLEEAVGFRQGSDLFSWRNDLASQAGAFLRTVPWFNTLDAGQRQRLALRFSDLFLKYFFTGDVRRAGIHLLNRADPTSTYGVMAATVLEAESAVWLRQRQPFYLWLSSDAKSVAASSEAKAFLGAKSGESPFRYRLTLGNGEVAALRGSLLTIDHLTLGRVAEYDLTKMDSVIADRRWLDLQESPHVVVSSAETAEAHSRVRDDVDMIPWVNQQLAEDFARPGTHNALTGAAFVKTLIDRLGRRRGAASRGLDLVLVGTEKSYDAAAQYALALEKLSSLAGRRLNVRVVYGAEFTRDELIKLRDEGFGVDTVVMGLASSGQTANTFYTLEALHSAWKGLFESQHPGEPLPTPPHFLVSADMDNPYTEDVLGQGLAANDTFKARNFVTFPKLDPFHPAEAATVTHKATERLLKETTVLFARSLDARSRRWAGRALPAAVGDLIRQMVDNGDELDRRIVGKDADGNPHVQMRRTGEHNVIPDQIQKMGDLISRAFLESLWASAGTALFIAVTLLFHTTPASVLMGWLPQQAFVFAGGVPVLAAAVAMVSVLAAGWKLKAWKWHPLFLVLGATALLGTSLFLGEGVTMFLDAVGQWLGRGSWGSRWGVVPVFIDVSPVNLANVATYVFFYFSLTLVLRKLQGRPLWDRLGGRILVLSDAQHANARLSAARWRRMLGHRFGWMGLQSVNESSLGRLTHEEALNSNVRGNIYIQGENRTAQAATIMNYKQLGGSPNGPGRVWRMGIGHNRPGDVSPAYSEGYISLAMTNDNPAGDNPDLLVIQELVQDAPARDTAGMALTLAVAEKMSRNKPLDFNVGMTSSEAKTSTTQQPFAPLSDEEVRDVFGIRGAMDAGSAAGNESLGEASVSEESSEPEPFHSFHSAAGTPVAPPVVNPPAGVSFSDRVIPFVTKWVGQPLFKVTKVAVLVLTLTLLTSHGDKVVSVIQDSAAHLLERPTKTHSAPRSMPPSSLAPVSLAMAESSVPKMETSAPMKTYLWIRDQKTGKTRLKTGEIPAGSEFAFLRYNKNKTLVRVKPENSRAVWVKAKDYKAFTASENAPSSRPQPLSQTTTAVAAGPLASLLLLMGPAGPALAGLERRRREAASTQPGALLRRRLLAGAKKPFSELDRGVAQALINEMDDSSDSSWDVQSVRLALGYGGLAGGSWTSDRGLADDFRRTRALLKGEALSRAEGRALSTLARLAGGWQRLNPASAFDEGALPVLYLADAQSDTQLFRLWNAALLRHRAGAQPPVLVVRSADQQARLIRALEQWRAEHPDTVGDGNVDLSVGRWVVLDQCDERVVTRNGDGDVERVNVGALLQSVEIELNDLRRVDLVTGVASSLRIQWDRSDLPVDVVVRLILGVFQEMALGAPLENAQNAVRSVRRALVAA